MLGDVADFVKQQVVSEAAQNGWIELRIGTIETQPKGFTSCVTQSDFARLKEWLVSRGCDALVKQREFLVTSLGYLNGKACSLRESNGEFVMKSAINETFPLPAGYSLRASVCQKVKVKPLLDPRHTAFRKVLIERYAVGRVWIDLQTTSTHFTSAFLSTKRQAEVELKIKSTSFSDPMGLCDELMQVLAEVLGLLNQNQTPSSALREVGFSCNERDDDGLQELISQLLSSSPLFI